MASLCPPPPKPPAPRQSRPPAPRVTAKSNFLSVMAVLLLAIAWAVDTKACTIGVADGTVTSDGRAILWKSCMETPGDFITLDRATGGTYNYLYFKFGSSDSAWTGLNSAGLASGNSAVTLYGSGNADLVGYCLKNCATVDQVRTYLGGPFLNDPIFYSTIGCFPFIDATGDAALFEVNGGQLTVVEYDTQDPDRAAQNLVGRVVRANEFHAHPNGTDDIMITGRYQSGNTNTTGLINVGDLCARTVVQGKFFHGSGYEFLRYGPGLPMATIANDSVVHSSVVHGVAQGENPALATMWAMLGQANYTIAVPTWVSVVDVPDCLRNGDMTLVSYSLHAKGNEGTVLDSILPLEAHLFDEIDELLSFWRTYGIPRPATATRVEHRMAEDAYSLLDCLDNTDDDNKAPTVALQAVIGSGLTMGFTCTAVDADGAILSYEWDFGDWSSTSDQPSPVHTYSHSGWHLVSCTVTDSDGVSNTDWEYVYTVPGPSAGDANGDGVVDAVDYIALKTNFGMREGATLAQGNFDADIDGNVDWDDLQILIANFGTRGVGRAPPAPEPATLGLLAIGALAVIRRRRK